MSPFGRCCGFIDSRVWQVASAAELGAVECGGCLWVALCVSWMPSAGCCEASLGINPPGRGFFHHALRCRSRGAVAVVCWKRSLQHRASMHQNSPQSSSSSAAPTFPPPTLEALFYYHCPHWRGLRSPQPLNPHGPPAPLVAGSTRGLPGMNVPVTPLLSPVRALCSPLHLPWS